jgi:hypothetical protein
MHCCGSEERLAHSELSDGARQDEEAIGSQRELFKIEQSAHKKGGSLSFGNLRSVQEFANRQNLDNHTQRNRSGLNDLQLDSKLQNGMESIESDHGGTTSR